METTYKLDTVIKVEENLCIGCGSCIRNCPANVIEKKEVPTPTIDAWDQCIDCGHCVAICPTGAMRRLIESVPEKPDVTLTPLAI